MFSQAKILYVNPPIQDNGQLILSWVALPLATGYSFQVYVDGNLWYNGTLPQCVLPALTAAVSHIDVGTVGPGEGLTSFASSLPVGPRRRTYLSWQGGSFEGTDIAGFHVYGESSPGSGIDYATVLAEITAYPANKITDGYGLGPYGAGGYGQSASLYNWTSDPRSSGTWNWAVKPFDIAGNEGAAIAVQDTLCVPPLESPFFNDNTRLHYTLSTIGPLTATLTWLPSPG